MILTKEQEEFLHEMYLESNDFQNWIDLMEQSYGSSCDDTPDKVEH